MLVEGSYLLIVRWVMINENLIKEQKELAERLGKLKTFTESAYYSALPCRDKFLLRQQLRFMTGYEIILRQRINRIGG